MLTKQVATKQRIHDAAQRLGIRSKLVVHFASEDTEDQTLAQVEPNPYGTEWDFTVYPIFFGRPDTDEIIAHELAHVLLFPLSAVAERLSYQLIESLRKSKTRDTLKATVSEELNHHEDNVCETLAPLLAQLIGGDI